MEFLIIYIRTFLQNYLHTNMIFVLVLVIMKKQAFWLYPNFMSRGLKNSVYFSGLLQSIDGNCVEWVVVISSALPSAFSKLVYTILLQQL